LAAYYDLSTPRIDLRKQGVKDSALLQKDGNSQWLSLTGIAFSFDSVLDAEGAPRIMVLEKKEAVQETQLDSRLWETRRLLSEDLRVCSHMGLGSGQGAPTPALQSFHTPPTYPPNSVAVDSKALLGLFKTSPGMIRDTLTPGSTSFTATPPSFMQCIRDLLSGYFEKGRCVSQFVLTPGDLLTVVGQVSATMVDGGEISLTVGPGVLLPMAVYHGWGRPGPLDVCGGLIAAGVLAGVGLGLLYCGFSKTGDGQETRGESAPPTPREYADFIGSHIPDTPAEAGSGGGACVVCLESRACVVFEECGHLSLCGLCTRTIFERNRTCPVCRGHITKAVRVFAS